MMLATVLLSALCVIATCQPNHTTDRKFHSSEVYGRNLRWQPGSCNFNTSDKSIDISKIKQGIWFLYSSKHFLYYGMDVHLDPFAVCSKAFYDFSCINIILTYLTSTSELVMDFRCRQSNGTLYTYPDCRYYVKFTSDRRIKYEVAYKCSINVGVDKVEIAQTDYKTFIIIRGCFERTYNGGKLSQNVFSILVQPEFSLNELQKHYYDIGEDELPLSLMAENRLLNTSLIYMDCECEEHTCLKDSICLPMEFFTTIKNKNHMIVRYMILVLLLTVMIALVHYTMIDFFKICEK